MKPMYTKIAMIVNVLNPQCLVRILLSDFPIQTLPYDLVFRWLISTILPIESCVDKTVFGVIITILSI